MKLFSRKALVAGAAAVALSFAGTSAAVAAEETTTPSETPAPSEGQTPGEPGEDDQTPGEPGEDDQDNTGNGGSSSNNGDDENDKDENKGSSDAKEISAWISVFTAVIGALGALFSFASKYLGFKL